MADKHRVVIVGGGFGGLYTAQALRKAPVEITLIDRRNFHLFQPLLYQVATGGLSPANIASPLRALLGRQRNTRVLMADVVGFDLDRREVRLASGPVVGYDSLIVAAGARHHYFNHPEWEKDAPGLKTVEDALEIRRRVLYAFEAAEATLDPKEQERWLTFVVVGAGATGVELAGALGEVAHRTLRHDFRSIQPSRARILLLEGAERVLGAYVPKLSQKAADALRRLGVDVRTGTIVTDVQPNHATVRSGDRTEIIPTRTVLWAAGVDASPLARRLAEATGAELDRAGRILVSPELSLPQRPEVFVIGDMANFPHQTGQPLPGVAQVAMQQGKHVAALIQRRLRGEPPLRFHYHDRGSMATIGANSAVADLGWAKFNGYLAWLTWLFVHLIFIVEFENRLLVLVQWAWNYFTRNRSARLITGPPPESEEPRGGAA
ncbi:MAG TPA: NAD(P)/FAD-dependent oxidoreductase [Gemmataceae bacterium]|nr:NAD(P)/FAD-dependent oxidoreductase [Gemmataceae bacterium]